jgi:23S rRNA-/tRNA-specific pseudouridylate synthase
MATSGLLMFAKHRDAEVAVSKCFQARTVKKHYIALVQGQVAQEGRRSSTYYSTGKIAQDKLYILN